MHKNLLKLFRQLIKLGSIVTEKATLYFDGEAVVVGSEVFIENENGELVVAPDGEYDEYVVADGKIAEIKEKEVEEEVKEEEKVEQEIVDDEKEALKVKIAELEAIIAELQAKIKEIEEKKVEEEFANLKPAAQEIKDFNFKEKGALKYFQD